MHKNFFYTGVAAMALLLSACSRPIAKFTYEGEQKAPARVSFDNQSEKAETYLWNFGDGKTSDEPSPEHRYLSSGNYVVTLKAMKDGKSRMAEERVVIDAPQACLVELETPYGNMLIELFDSTPRHQENFIKLVEENFYDSLLFHRVINGFMIQGGDPESRNAPPNKQLGSGGPGYNIPAEFVDSLVHIKGMLAAARKGDNVNPQKKSSGSQFYIVQGRAVDETTLDRLEAQKGFRYTKDQREAYLKLGGTPFLDKEYTVFGRVIEGMDVIDKIAAVETNQPGNRPVKDVWMKARLIR